MEIGDLFYVIIMLLFMILGIFNDSRKKKEQQKHLQDQDSKGATPPALSVEQQKKYELENKKKLLKREWKEKKHKKEGNVIYRSSMNSLTDFSSSFEHETMAAGKYKTDITSPEMRENKSTIHPLVKDLYTENCRKEIAKGIIYSEILNRKY